MARHSVLPFFFFFIYIFYNTSVPETFVFGYVLFGLLNAVRCYARETNTGNRCSTTHSGGGAGEHEINNNDKIKPCPLQKVKTRVEDKNITDSSGVIRRTTEEKNTVACINRAIY